jgi:hypothetical protein
MPYDGQGVFTRVHNWEEDAANDISILASRHDAEDDNFANGFNEVLCRDGRAAMTGNLKMGANKITGLANGTNTNDGVNKSQLDSLSTTLSSSITNLDNTVVKLSGNQTIADTKTFSSSPIIPTPATSDNSTKAATTAYVNSILSSSGGLATWSQGQNGYYKFSNGLIIQWGKATTGTVTLPTAFTSGTSYSIGAQLEGSGAGANDYGQLNSLTSTSFNWVMYSGSSRLFWVAIGY